jgi:hypothetical protein
MREYRKPVLRIVVRHRSATVTAYPLRLFAGKDEYRKHRLPTLRAAHSGRVKHCRRARMDDHAQNQLHLSEAAFGIAMQEAVVTKRRIPVGRTCCSTRHRKSAIGRWRYAGLSVVELM